MKHKILKYTLIFLTLTSGFFSWLSVYRAINVPASSDWLVPLAWFSFFYVVICFDAILIRNSNMLKVLLALSFLFSFIFAFYAWHIIVFILAVLLIFVAKIKIRKDLNLNIKIDLGKSITTGRIFMIVALGLLISSQFFFEAQRKQIQTIPKFDLSGVVETVAPKSINKEDMGFIDEKVNDYFKPEIGQSKNPSLLPAVLAVALFLTILPLGSLLAKILIFPVRIIFYLLVKSGFVSIEKEMKEVETIVL